MPRAPRDGAEVIGALSGLLLEAVKDLCEADAASILEIDRDGQLCFRLVDGGAGEELAGKKLSSSDSVAGRVLQTCEPEIVHAGETGVPNEILGYATRSLVAAPLVDDNGRLVGVVEAVNATSGCFDRRHLEALVRLSTPIANALRAAEDLGTDAMAMQRFYRAVVDVMAERGAGLKDLNDELVHSRRTFELDRAKRYSDQKMAGLARMSCGIAHEVNNPLSVVQSNLNTGQEITAELTALLKTVALEPAVREEVDLSLADLDGIGRDMRDALARIAKVTDRLMAFGHMELGRVEELDIRAELFRLADLFESHGPTDVPVPIDVEIADDLPTMVSSRTHVRQALMELVDNGVRAAARVEQGQLSLRAFGDATNVYVTVTDNGPGIPAAVQGQVFDPFFTTKSDWRATGLGLTAAYGVVKALGGSISIDSAAGRGTSVSVSFPLSPPATVVDTSGSPSRAQPTHRSLRYYEDLG